MSNQHNSSEEPLVVDGVTYDPVPIVLPDGRDGFQLVPREEKAESIFRSDNDTIDTIDAVSAGVLGPRSRLWDLNKHRTSVAVAGSFLLHCRLKKGAKGWSPNDVDIWCEDHVYDQAVTIVSQLTGIAPTHVTERTTRVGLYQLIKLDTSNNPKHQVPWAVTSSFDFTVLNGCYAGGRSLMNAAHQATMRLTKGKVPDTPAFRARVAKYVARGFDEPEYLTPDELAREERQGTWYFNSDYRGHFRAFPGEV